MLCFICHEHNVKYEHNSAMKSRDTRRPNWLIELVTIVKGHYSKYTDTNAQTPGHSTGFLVTRKPTWRASPSLEA